MVMDQESSQWSWINSEGVTKDHLYIQFGELHLGLDPARHTNVFLQQLILKRFGTQARLSSSFHVGD